MALTRNAEPKCTKNWLATFKGQITISLSSLFYQWLSLCVCVLMSWRCSCIIAMRQSCAFLRFGSTGWIRQLFKFLVLRSPHVTSKALVESSIARFCGSSTLQNDRDQIPKRNKCSCWNWRATRLRTCLVRNRCEIKNEWYGQWCVQTQHTTYLSPTRLLFFFAVLFPCQTLPIERGASIDFSNCGLGAMTRPKSAA